MRLSRQFNENAKKIMLKDNLKENSAKFRRLEEAEDLIKKALPYVPLSNELHDKISKFLEERQ